MSGVSITHSGVTPPSSATEMPYSEVHVSDFMDVWLPETTVGVDHLITATGEVRLRVKGRRLQDLP